ncbi:glycosyltransferase family 2 protein [Glycomyces tritici]|uniref:Glycosyltransferase n=1 Tax=Glycomyces tritici TaxID=2665176 RepID=A0ABT7YPS1_9ACTN|nr:glycosyltransferase [Glycomyces tritici]MDN3240602.1 glycosyltransferase [Glycomyces tritici]
MNQPVPDTASPLRVKRNRYDAIDAPRLGAWEPDAVVSVVIPAYGAQEELDVTLAALAAQSYPAALLDVVVVDDGSEPPLRLPELKPERTRIVRAPEGQWGVAAAVDFGIDTAEGDVIVRLDSDVLPDRTHVEAHARWHQKIDYCVVIGNLGFVEIEAEELDLEKVHAAVASDAAETLFGTLEIGQSWEISLLERTERLLEDELRAYSVTNGATISFTKAFYSRCGGIDKDLKLGSDTELGYRQAQAGAVFVPEAQARAWHLGESQLQSRNEAGKRYRQPFVANRVPTLRHLRTQPGITWRVPLVEVTVDVAEATFEQATASVASALSGSLQDFRVLLKGPWSQLSGDRVRPLDDPQLELRLLREVFSADHRVSYVEEWPETAAPAPFRLELVPGTVLRPDGLRDVLAAADKQRAGRIKFLTNAHGGTPRAVLDRTAAVSRALATLRPDEDLDQAVEEAWGLRWADGGEWFAHWEDEDLGVTPMHLLQRTASLTAAVKRLEVKEAELRKRVTRWNRAGNAARDEAKKWELATRHWQRAAEAWQQEPAPRQKPQRPFLRRVKDRLRRR